MFYTNTFTRKKTKFNLAMGGGIRGLHATLFTFTMTLLMLAGPPDLWGQDCIDFEKIDETLSELKVVCDCSNPIQLGEPDEIRYISEYSLNSMQSKECFEIFGTLVLDLGMYFENCDFIMDDGALIRIINSSFAH